MTGGVLHRTHAVYCRANHAAALLTIAHVGGGQAHPLSPIIIPHLEVADLESGHLEREPAARVVSRRSLFTSAGEPPPPHTRAQFKRRMQTSMALAADDDAELDEEVLEL